MFWKVRLLPCPSSVITSPGSLCAPLQLLFNQTLTAQLPWKGVSLGLGSVFSLVATALFLSLVCEEEEEEGWYGEGSPAPSQRAGLRSLPCAGGRNQSPETDLRAGLRAGFWGCPKAAGGCSSAGEVVHQLQYGPNQPSPGHGAHCSHGTSWHGVGAGVEGASTCSAGLVENISLCYNSARTGQEEAL